LTAEVIDSTDTRFTVCVRGTSGIVGGATAIGGWLRGQLTSAFITADLRADRHAAFVPGHLTTECVSKLWVTDAGLAGFITTSRGVTDFAAVCWGFTLTGIRALQGGVGGESTASSQCTGCAIFIPGKITAVIIETTDAADALFLLTLRCGVAFTT